MFSLGFLKWLHIEEVKLLSVQDSAPLCHLGHHTRQTALDRNITRKTTSFVNVGALDDLLCDLEAQAHILVESPEFVIAVSPSRTPLP